MPDGSLYEGAFFRAEISFPQTFPIEPPEVKFITKVFHPNIYKNGKVRISILHSPGVDAFNEMETADERWRPIISVEAVLVSIMSMLTDKTPNLDSPANIDAAVMYKDDKAAFKKEVKRCVQRSQEF